MSNRRKRNYQPRSRRVPVQPYSRRWPLGRKPQRVQVSAYTRESSELHSALKISKPGKTTSLKKSRRVTKDNLSSHADRGRDAERVFEREFQDKATIERASGGHDFFLTFHNGRKWYVDVKRVENKVSSGGTKLEPGRVQIEKSELETWLKIEREQNCTAWLVVAVQEKGRFKWRRIKAKDVGPLVKGKQDPYKLTMTQIEKLEDFSL